MRDLEARERAFQSDRQAEQEARAKLKVRAAAGTLTALLKLLGRTTLS